jgi:hypothetical protein
VSDALKAVLELETALGNARQSERIMQVMNDFWSNTIV